MFRLQSAVIALDHQLDHVVHEARILVNYGLVVEALGNDEVQISVLGMTKDDGVLILVFVEELSKVVGCVSQGFDGERNVFDDDGGAALAYRTHRRKQAGAYFPQQRLLRCYMRESGRLVQFQAAYGVRGNFL